MTADVAVVIESMGGGGAQQVASALLQHWINTGRRVDLITLRGAEADTFQVPSLVRRHILGDAQPSCNPFGAIAANARRLAGIRTAVRASGAAVVLSFVTATNVLAVLACLGLRCRVVISERNDPRRQKIDPEWTLLRRLTYPLADTVTANSQMAVRTLVEEGISRNATWVPNPLRRPETRETVPKGGPLLLAVGRLHPQKGYEDLLAAFAQARPSMPGWTLRILGDGTMGGDLKRLAAHLDLADAVEFAGYVADPFPHYRAADLFVLASRYEGSPNALWEAMSCGVPAVVTDSVEGALDVLTDGADVAVVPGGDVAALATALARLARDPSACRRLGAAGRETVLKIFGDNVLAVWDRLLFGNGGDRGKPA